ncbi:MAG: type II toxin-antitoxin system RelE/ParE family toxin [Phascolarctobacterium sp.]|nr:MAG: type II toxin-antitoxin system RelE/ParE family toxin [Phascolarctobacterium sp.]
MNYKIILAHQFSKDFESVYDYISFVLQNQTAAINITTLAQAKINTLPDFPEKYPLVNDISLAHKQIRYIPVDNYLIFYRINKIKNEIQILRFLYAKSNWLNILKTNNTTFNYPENLFEDKHYINEVKEKYK